MLGAPDVHELAFAERQAGLVVEAHEAQHAGILEALVGESVERHAAEREERVAGVDGLRDAGHGPQRRPMPALQPAVLDVVVDEAEVVTHLHGSRARQRPDVVTRDGLVGQQADERAHALAARRVAVQAEVVAHHGVELARAVVLGVADDGEDGSLGIGDEAVEVDAGQHGEHDTCR